MDRAAPYSASASWFRLLTVRATVCRVLRPQRRVTTLLRTGTGKRQTRRRTMLDWQTVVETRTRRSQSCGGKKP